MGRGSGEQTGQAAASERRAKGTLEEQQERVAALVFSTLPAPTDGPPGPGVFCSACSSNAPAAIEWERVNTIGMLRGWIGHQARCTEHDEVVARHVLAMS